jgi:hypothetical protein
MHPLRALGALLLGLGGASGSHRCWPGTTPGGWLSLEHGVRDGHGGGNEWLYYNRLSGPNAVWLQASTEHPEHPFGSNWRSYDAACPLSNLLARYWTAEPDPSVQPATIVLLGDSVDSYFIDFLCGEADSRGVKGWHAFVHSHNIVNYCILPSGLRLVQIYLLRSNAADDLQRVDVVRRLFHGEDDVSGFDGKDGDRSTLEGRPEEVALFKGTSPDLVVFASAYWPLQHFAGAFSGHTPLLLPPDFVDSFTSDTLRLVAAARAAFPHAQLAVHTSAGIRTDPIYGSNVDNSNHRIWGRKTYVAQLNAALRVVAQSGHAKLVDFELLAAALTAAQLTVDDVHPRSFFSLEVINVYLNMIEGHRNNTGGHLLDI